MKEITLRSARWVSRESGGCTAEMKNIARQTLRTQGLAATMCIHFGI